MNFFSTNVAYAGRLDTFLTNVNQFIINPLILFLFALALVFFLYGVFEFIANLGNEEKKTTGKSHMLWGIVGLTIMVGVWTILGVILNTLEIDDQIDPKEGTVNLDPYIPSR
ncbi:hypothetical protein HYZ82_02265 [Candidatus Nomurabacteria bacterium]|nr:hypothetical protein [Candidatus Nomurabacteria bacterium]